MPEERHDRRFWLQLKGVFQATDVWVNGHHAGRHVSGYTSFGFDVTEFLHHDVPNLVAVKVDDVWILSLLPPRKRT